MSKEYIGGHAYTMAEVLDFQAMPTPPVSPAGYARLYFNSALNRMQISHSTGAYQTILDYNNDFKIKAGQKLILDGSDE